MFLYEKRVGGCGGGHWVLSTPKALTRESPLVHKQPSRDDTNQMASHVKCFRKYNQYPHTVLAHILHSTANNHNGNSHVQGARFTDNSTFDESLR